MNQILAPQPENPRHIEININNLRELSTLLLDKLQMLEQKLEPALSNKLMQTDRLDILETDNDKSPIAKILAGVCNTLVECDAVTVNIQKRLEI